MPTQKSKASPMLHRQPALHLLKMASDDASVSQLNLTRTGIGPIRRPTRAIESRDSALLPCPDCDLAHRALVLCGCRCLGCIETDLLKTISACSKFMLLVRRYTMLCTHSRSAARRGKDATNEAFYIHRHARLSLERCVRFFLFCFASD